MKQYKIRSMVIAPKDHVLVQFDFSQAESWIVAFLSNEQNMKNALMYGDIHTETAGSALFYKHTGCNHQWVKKTKTCSVCGKVVTTEMRYSGKRTNHASAYRMKGPKLATIINKDSDKPPYVTVTNREAKDYIDGWHSYYNIKGWWHEVEEQLNRNRTIITCYGRKRVFYSAWGEELFREATAHEPQSTVADHANGAIHPELGIKGGFLEVYNQFHVPGRIQIINQSHDSILNIVHKKDLDDIVPQIHKLLARPIALRGEMFTIPVDCEYGERWGEFESYKLS
jgi:DNA polymerase I - 3''-5'' exonuclease and polymerase domains